ncbi:autotransporter outer membrane beta-barrel domain-containing protein, partial [Klebsiella michiganensis]
YITNVDGKGELTNKGIELIDISGNSNGVFTQGNQVQIGLYEYRLYKDTGDWYLRSQSNAPVDPKPDDGNNGNVDPVKPDEGNHGDTTPSGSHQYRADIGAYLGNQWMVRNLQMQTLYDRVGSQLRTANGNMWMRFKAGRADSQAVSGNVDINNNYSQIQIGGDILAWDNGEQSLVTGIMGSYINADTDSTGNRGMDGSQLSASGNVSGYNVGIYSTWFADSQTHRGLYIDSWYQYGMYSNTVKNGDISSTDYDSHTHTASLEAGYRYDVPLKEGHQISLTPQAQIIWQNYSADTVIDKGRTRIDGQSSSSWASRLGLRVDGKLYKNRTSVIQPFAEVNWLHTNDDISVAFNHADVQMDLPANRAELKAGIQVNLNNQWSVTGMVTGQKGSNHYDDLNGSLNVLYSW